MGIGIGYNVGGGRREDETINVPICAALLRTPMREDLMNLQTKLIRPLTLASVLLFLSVGVGGVESQVVLRPVVGSYHQGMAFEVLQYDSATSCYAVTDSMYVFGQHVSHFAVDDTIFVVSQSSERAFRSGPMPAVWVQKIAVADSRLTRPPMDEIVISENCENIGFDTACTTLPGVEWSGPILMYPELLLVTSTHSVRIDLHVMQVSRIVEYVGE